jgi:hypothetical protein
MMHILGKPSLLHRVPAVVAASARSTGGRMDRVDFQTRTSPQHDDNTR